MSRPQLLFLASPGQLTVYDLTKPPPKPSESLLGSDRLIGIATSIAEVQSKLGAYHRERIETGLVSGKIVFAIQRIVRTAHLFVTLRRSDNNWRRFPFLEV